MSQGPTPAAALDGLALDGPELLALARDAVGERLGIARPAPARPSSPRLATIATERAATFVTIERGDQLHGCIGSLEAHRPLLEDLRHNAIMAAFHDPRSRALEPDELADARFSISVLGPRAPLAHASQADARAQLRPGVDGLVLRWAGHRGVFLPKVWDQLPTPAAFLDGLKRKAGLALDFWHPQIGLERFEVRLFAEPRR